jgi:hypothetical protein
MRDEWISYATLRKMGPDLLRARISESPAQAARWVEAGALNGLIHAQIAWGRMLIEGHGTRLDPAAGLRWFGVAAKAGSAEGINMVGRCHELGWGTPVDFAQAARHYREAAEKGHGWAQFNLATLLLDGRGVPADRGEALRWYVRAARRGNAKAMTMIGRYLELGWDRPARPAAALRWYRHGAQGDDYRGQFDYARLLLERTGQLEAALPWFARAIDNGVPAFCRNIGAGLREAEAPALRHLARRALERAVATGDAHDLRAYASALAEGLGGEPDAAAARALFARARSIEAEAPRSEPPALRRRPTFRQRLARRLRYLAAAALR